MSKKNRDVTVKPNGDAVYTPEQRDDDAALNAGIDDTAPPESKPMVGSQYASPGHSNGKKPTISKRERFVKHAERRVGKAVKALGHVKNLGNKASYEYSEEEAAIILGALDSAVKDIRMSFTGTVEKRETFRLFEQRI